MWVFYCELWNFDWTVWTDLRKWKIKGNKKRVFEV